MKWKYFFRGLGTGILIATLILCIAYRHHRGSGLDVVKEAKKLGMVFPEGTAPPDDDKIVERTEKPSESPGKDEQSSDSDSNQTQSKESGTMKKKSSDSTEKATATPKTKDSSKSSTKKSDAGKSSSAKNKSASDKDSNKTSEKKKASSQAGSVIEVTVRDASTSIAAVRELAAAGVISDILEFDHFLRDNGYSPRVRAGIYSIPKNATYDQIAKIITHQA